MLEWERWGGGDRERGDALCSGSLVPADNSATSNERRNSNSSEGYGGGVILRPDKSVVMKRSVGLTSNASHRYKNSPRTIKLTEKTPHNVVVCTKSKIYTRETRKGVIEKSLSMNAQVYE